MAPQLAPLLHPYTQDHWSEGRLLWELLLMRLIPTTGASFSELVYTGEALNDVGIVVVEV